MTKNERIVKCYEMYTEFCNKNPDANSKQMMNLVFDLYNVYEPSAKNNLDIDGAFEMLGQIMSMSMITDKVSVQ